jgi:hypothetical protein
MLGMADVQPQVAQGMGMDVVLRNDHMPNQQMIPYFYVFHT